YPCRAIRTTEFLYIRNFHLERWPAGDPEMWKDVGPFGDIDGGPTKNLLLRKRNDKEIAKFFELACAKRPPGEVYDVVEDPHELTNLADRREYAEAKRKLRTELEQWMRETKDPRAAGDDDRWDRYPYFGGQPKKSTER